MKLEIELVPATSWGNNVRSMVPRGAWDVIRKDAYKRYNHQCGICGAKGKLEAHEIWEFDNEKQIQTLRGIIALCSLCHRVKHIGLTELLAAQGKLNLDQVIDHFCKVNECSRSDYVNYRNESFQLWQKRSEQEWDIDISLLAELAKPKIAIRTRKTI